MINQEMVVDLLPGAEQLEIVAAAGKFLAERMPVERIRANRYAESSVPEQLWREGAEMGLLTLGLDEQFGGSGRPFDDEVLLFVDQSVSNTNVPDPRIDRSRVKMTMEYADRRWRASKVELP